MSKIDELKDLITEVERTLNEDFAAGLTTVTAQALEQVLNKSGREIRREQWIAICAATEYKVKIRPEVVQNVLTSGFAQPMQRRSATLEEIQNVLWLVSASAIDRQKEQLSCVLREHAEYISRTFGKDLTNEQIQAICDGAIWQLSLPIDRVLNALREEGNDATA